MQVQVKEWENSQGIRLPKAVLGIGPNDLMNDLKTFGFLFETLCIRDLRFFSDALKIEIQLR